jgi:hypothetical protein
MMLQVQRLQLLLHKHWPAEQFPDLAELALANCGTMQKREALAKATASLDLEQLRLLVCRQLGWVAARLQLLALESAPVLAVRGCVQAEQSAMSAGAKAKVA